MTWNYPLIKYLEPLIGSTESPCSSKLVRYSRGLLRGTPNSTEHGSLPDDEGARLMAKKGTFLVSTLMPR